MEVSTLEIAPVHVNVKSKPCIFCINDEPAPTLYQGICNCHPPIHSDCINDWYKNRPGTCPICLKREHNEERLTQERTEHLIIIANSRFLRRFLIVCFMLCCFAIAGLSALLVVSITLYSPTQIAPSTNTTVGSY